MESVLIALWQIVPSTPETDDVQADARRFVPWDPRARRGNTSRTGRWVHSDTFPRTSYKPNPLGCLSPTAWAFALLFMSNQAMLPPSP
jgi:hypothetical protein